MTAEKFVNESKAMLRLSDCIFDSQQILSPIKGYEIVPLVSLEQAMEPIVSLSPDVQQMVQTVKQRCQHPEDNLSQDESASIMLYTLESPIYTTLNLTLQDENRQKLKPWFLYLRLLIFALSKLPSTPSRTVYRAVKEDINQEFSKGQTFIWWTFSFCTSSIQTIKQYLGQNGHYIMFIIDCHSAKDISRHSFDRTENQILLYPARQFQILSSVSSEIEVRTIHLKEIQPLLPLIHIPPPTSSSIIHCEISYENKQLQDLINKYEYHTRINLYQKNLNNNDMNIVVKLAINEKQCNELWLENNQITSVGATIIANALNNNNTLMWLSLSSNRLCDNGIEVLAEALTLNNSTLTTLALHATGITDKGAKDLAEMLKRNRTLMELELSGNEIGSQGVQLLAGVLTHDNSTIRWLSLSNNRLISDACIDDLIEMLEHNRKLQELSIDNCSLSSDGKERLQYKAQSKKSFSLKV